MARLTVLGDSFAAGRGEAVHGWVRVLARLLGIPEDDALNLGAFEATTQVVLDSQVAAAVASKAPLIGVVVGVNDLLSDYTPARFLGNLERIFAALAGPGTTVFTATYADIPGNLAVPEPFRVLLRQRFTEANEGLRAIAARFGVLCADVAATARWRAPALWSADGIHPTAEGHRLFAETVADALGRRETTVRARRLADNPIAIVGMAGLFPRARNSQEYWQNVVEAVDCTSDVPADRWNVDDYYDPDPTAPDKTYSRRGAFIPDVEFNPVEFGLPPNQLDVTSTLQTLSLGVARDLLHDAGATGSVWYDPSRTGVVLGVTGPVPLMHPLAARLSTPVLKEVVRSCGLSEQDADAVADKYVQAFAPWEESSFPGLLANVVAGRVANRLGLGGMNCTVDAACAASLSAIRMAVAELVDGRADLMISGGCDTENSIFGYLCFSKTQALSRSGRIRPFDDDADGTLLGEGIGMVALKRLADAERDGDRIYAVIRGIGSSSDGRATSIYAPHAQGQRLALQRAYEDADCSPSSVELFEAHATATAIGDRTELTALGGVLGEASTERRFAALGSVKSQIGHTKGAAGAASVMKVALALYHKTLPPTINVDRPNRAIDEVSGPFYVNTRTRPWILDPARPRRRAAASAMGFGGTNFHVVVEEHSPDRAAVRILHRAARARMWHAPDSEGLVALLRAGAPASELETIPGDHARLGYVAVGDDDELHRLALERLTEHPDAAQWSHPRGIAYRRRALPDLVIGALFAGQGSQYLDMGLRAALNNPVVAAAFDEANAEFAGAAQRLGSAVYPPPVFDAGLRNEQETTLRRTEFAQPAIGALCAGQFRFLRELGLRCSAYLGHSFGELTALWAAEALSDGDFFRLARARGLAMAQRDGADQGAMAAVHAGREQAEGLIREFDDLVICNHNAPEQVVIGGDSAQVAALVEACAEAGIGARLLPVAAAFHTRHVAHAVETFRAAVEKSPMGAPAAPVFANRDGGRYGADPEENRRLLADQLRHPVEFVAGLRALAAEGCTVLVEFGPRQVLTQLARRTLGDAVIVIPTDSGPQGDSDVALTRAAVQLAVLGAPITGINRYHAPRDEPVKAGATTVTLSAPEHVPQARRAAYQAALADGHQIRSAPAIATSAADEALHTQVTLHRHYLDSQLEIAEALAAALRERSDLDGARLAAVEQVVAQSVRIGEAHAHANDVLAALAALDSGVVPPRQNGSSAPAVAELAVTNGHRPPEPDRPETELDAAALRALLRAVVAEKTGYPVDMVDPGMDLESDLGVDSIKRVQVLGAVQERFPQLPVIGPESLVGLRTVDQIVAFFTDVPESRQGSAPRHPIRLLRLPAADAAGDPFGEHPVAVVVDHGGGPGSAAIAAALQRRGWQIRTAHLAPGDEGWLDEPEWDSGQIERQLEQALAGRVDACLLLLGAEPHIGRSVRRLADAVLVAKHAHPRLSVAGSGRAAFLTITRVDGGLGLRGEQPTGAAILGAVGGLVKTLSREAPRLFCRSVDLAPELDADAAAAAVLAELYDAAPDTGEVGVDGAGVRWTAEPGPATDDDEAGALAISPEDVIVVSGGARGVTARCVVALARRCPAEFVLLGRTKLAEEPAWARGVADADLRAAAVSALAADGALPAPRDVRAIEQELLARREIHATLQALLDAGARARYIAADVTDSAAVRQALRADAPRVTAVVHGAGALADALLPDKTASDIRRVFGPKLAGLRHLLEALSGAPLRHVVLFSSVAGIFGNPGQADYAVANEALNRWAVSLSASDPRLRATAIAWSAWDGGMVTPELRDVFLTRGVSLLAPADGAQAFVEQFAEGRTETCLLIGPNAALEQGPPPAVTANHDIAGLATEPVIRAHQIGRHPVLPATVVIGWMIHAAERSQPGRQVVDCRDFAVLNGIVFDDALGGGHRVRLEPAGGDGLLVRATVHSDAIAAAHYTATLLLADAPPPAPCPRHDWPGERLGAGPEDGVDVYDRATLFHGPALQGIRRILQQDPTRLVVECRLADPPLAGGAFAGACYSPALADVTLQAPSVLGHALLGSACLPAAIARLELFAPLPGGSPFVVIVDEPRPAAGRLTVTATACDPDGRVLLRMTGVEVVSTPNLGDKFAQGAAAWQSGCRT